MKLLILLLFMKLLISILLFMLFMKLLISIVFWQNLDPEYESVLNTSLQWILNSGEDVGIK